MAKIVVLQNHPAESLGAIADSLETAALAWQYVRAYDGQPIPASIRGAGGLVVMGGPQTVYQLDRDPYLREEIRLIEDALRENKPILGVCLGSQLLAAALGAKVYRNETREIGWYRVTLATAATDDRLLRGLLPSSSPPTGIATSSTCRRARSRSHRRRKPRSRDSAMAIRRMACCFTPR